MSTRDTHDADQPLGATDRTTSAPSTRPRLLDARPGQPTQSDEAGDVSVANADHPLLVREDVNNTSDSSGPKVDDQARGEQIKEQLKRGLSEVQPMD